MKRNKLAILCSFFTTFAFLNKNPLFFLKPHNPCFYIITFFLLIILFLLFYKNTFLIVNKKFIVLGLLCASFMVIGDSYDCIGNLELILKNIIFFTLSSCKFIGFFLFFLNFFSFLYTLLIINKKDKPFYFKHPFFISCIVLFLCWLPYIISFYPAILSPDPSNQIKMFFGIKTGYIDDVKLLSSNVVITNHHPFLHTILLGGLAKLGFLIGNINLGLFLYSIIQVISLIITLSYSFMYMAKLQVNPKILFIILIIYALVPFYPFYGMSALKDVYFSIFILLYTIIFHQLLKNKDNKKLKITILILMALISWTRNNGIYTIILSFPFLFLKTKKTSLFFIFLIFLGLNFSYKQILLPSLKITPGSIREMFSIPFQQTARYVKYYQNEVTLKEKKAIQKILNYDTLALEYNPQKSDNIKNNFNKNASKEDLKEYFKVWFLMFFKHPLIYLEATINNTYGYFYPNTTNWYLYYKYDKRLKEVGLDYHYNSLNKIRNFLVSYGKIFPFIPGLGLLSNIACYVHIYLFLFCALWHKKKYTILPLFSIFFSLFFACIASPVNTYFRYALPFIFSLPTIFSISLKEIKDEN